MTGQEILAKVIRGLEDIREDYENTRCKVSVAVIDAAIALLKAQGPVEPIIETYWATPSVYDNDVKVTVNKCGACGAEIDKYDKHCRCCGRAVKWG